MSKRAKRPDTQRPTLGGQDEPRNRRERLVKMQAGKPDRNWDLSTCQVCMARGRWEGALCARCTAG